MLCIFLAIDRQPKPPCACEKKFTMFVTGKAGSGKTSLIYGLLGISEEEMNRKRQNSAVMLQTENITRNGIHVIISERRSLEHNEKEVAEEEVSKIQNMDLVLYTLRMDDARCRPGHKTGLRKLGEQFGTDLWNKTVIALTFANRVDYVDEEGKTESSQELLDEKKAHWTRCVYEVLAEEKIPETIMKAIPMVPVGYYKKPMLFDESWVDVLYSSMLSRLTDGRAYRNMKLAFNITS